MSSLRKELIMSNSEESNAQLNDYSGDSKVERIVRFAQANATFGVDKNDQAFAVLGERNNSVAYALYGKAFKKWLQYQAYQHDDILKIDDLNEALSILNAHATFEGGDLNVHLRIAPVPTGGVEIDCADTDNTRIRLENGTVSVLTKGSDLLFHQPQTMQSLPIPAEKGDWRALLAFLNMSEEEKLLFVGWITYVFAHPRDPSTGYPLLVIRGSQGTGKSFLCKSIIRGLVDPNVSGIQLFPKEPKDLVISSQNAAVLIYDNLRKLSKEWSDVLCIAATSGVLSSRKLYSDAEENVMHLHVPLVLNGIHNFIEEPDLASRCLNVQLFPLEGGQRESEKQLESRLKFQLPSIFRGLLDITAQALLKVDTVEVLYPERMLGFVHWLAALEQVIDLPNALQKSYKKNLCQALLDSIQESPLAYSVLQFAKQYTEDHWRGKPQDLLTVLGARVTQRVRNNSAQWPQNAIALSKRLSALQTALAAQGVVLVLGERNKHRQITLGFEVDTGN
jgi:hypothetical protein